MIEALSMGLLTAVVLYPVETIGVLAVLAGLSWGIPLTVLALKARR